jgi:hypothetical protein
LCKTHVGKLEHISAWMESSVQNLKALTYQAKAWIFPRLGLLRKEDAQDDCNIVEKKKSSFPKSIGKYVIYFIC